MHVLFKNYWEENKHVDRCLDQKIRFQRLFTKTTNGCHKDTASVVYMSQTHCFREQPVVPFIHIVLQNTPIEKGYMKKGKGVKLFVLYN